MLDVKKRLLFVQSTVPIFGIAMLILLGFLALAFAISWTSIAVAAKRVAL